MRVLAIDLGTSGVKVAVVGEDGRTLGSSTTPLPTTLTPDGGAEQDAEDWWTAIGSSSRAATAAAGGASGIGAVAVTSQYMSTLAVDRHGLPMSPVIMWMDHRGGAHHPVLRDREAFSVWLGRHGLPPLSNDGLAHIGLLRHRDPSLVDRGACFVEPVDAIVGRLTGRVTANQNSAFGLMLVDNTVHGIAAYDPEFLRRSGIEIGWLPELLPFGVPAGGLLPSAAEHLGVPVSAVVMGGTIDSITSAVGTGAIGPHSISLVLGTTSVMVSHVAAKRADHAHAISAVPSPVGGQYFVMAENGAGGKALDFVLRDLVYADDALALGRFPDDAFERAEVAAATATPGSGGTMFFPWLVGSVSPAPDDHLRAGFANLGLTTTRADMIRAVMEGVALNAAWLFGPVRSFTGVEHDSIRFGGGGARSELWASILAHALGVPVHQLADPANTNARGAALLALVQLGRLSLDDIPALLPVHRVHEPDAGLVVLYAELRERFTEYHGLTRGFHASLSRHP